MTSYRPAHGCNSLARLAAISLLCLCACFTPALAQTSAGGSSGQISELSLEDLMRIKVTTASRIEEQLQRSTSVMSVITARDIERAGFRTVYDVLARIPGFFPSSQATWKVMGSRGFLADGNDHILLLIDGHAQNSIVAHGFQQQDQIPALEKVERIEIIRGPGSVLWGTSAAHAIINIVTRDETARSGRRFMCRPATRRATALWTVNLLKNLRMGDAQGRVLRQSAGRPTATTRRRTERQVSLGSVRQCVASSRRAESRLRAVPEAQRQRRAADSGAMSPKPAFPIRGTPGLQSGRRYASGC